MADLQAQLGLKIKLFEEDIIGAIGYKKEEEKERIRILIKNPVDPKKDSGITVGQMAKSIADTIKKITGEEVPENKQEKKLLPDLLKGDSADEPATANKQKPIEILNEVYVNLKEVYLKIDRERIKDDNGKFKPWESKKDTEFALSLEINLTEDENKIEKLKDQIPIFNIIEPDGLFVRVWKTDNKKVLEEMGIFDFEKLPEASTSEDEDQSATG